MLALIKSFSAGVVSQREISRDRLLGLIKTGLSPEGQAIRIGNLYCKEFRGRICSGASAHGNAWGFAIAGRAGLEEQGRVDTFQRGGNLFEARRSSVSIRFFDAILHKNVSCTGAINRRLDICMPEEYCARAARILDRSAGPERRFLVEEFLYDFAIEIHSFEMPLAIPVPNYLTH